jgi:hypothetical protein
MDTSENNLYDEFKRLYQADLTYKQIKKQLNITNYRLELYVNKLKSEGLSTKREKQQATKDKAIELRKDNALSSQEIAEKLGIDKRTAYTFVHGISSIIPKNCELCNNKHNCEYGEGRFCCVECSRIFASNSFDRNKYWAKEENRINAFLHAKNKTKDNDELEDSSQSVPLSLRLYKCFICKKEFTPIHDKQQYCSRKCGSQSEKSIAHKKSETTRERNKQNALARVASGAHKGWQSRKKLAPSFPEKWFMDYFTNKNIIQDIHYKREHKCGKYFIDFAFEATKIALEIDGKQHAYEDRAKKDKEKDDYLNHEGWQVIRIKWRGLVNNTNYKIMLADIESVLPKLVN